MTDNAEALNEAIWLSFVQQLPGKPEDYDHKKKDFMVAALMVTTCLYGLICKGVIKPNNVLQFLEILSKDLEKWGENEFGRKAANDPGSGS